MEHNDGTWGDQGASGEEVDQQPPGPRRADGATNLRYLEYLAALDEPTACMRDFDRIGKPVEDQGRTSRGFNPLRRREFKLVEAIQRPTSMRCASLISSVCDRLVVRPGGMKDQLWDRWHTFRGPDPEGGENPGFNEKIEIEYQGSMSPGRFPDDPENQPFYVTVVWSGLKPAEIPHYAEMKRWKHCDQATAEEWHKRRDMLGQPPPT